MAQKHSVPQKGGGCRAVVMKFKQLVSTKSVGHKKHNSLCWSRKPTDVWGHAMDQWWCEVYVKNRIEEYQVNNKTSSNQNPVHCWQLNNSSINVVYKNRLFCYTNNRYLFVCNKSTLCELAIVLFYSDVYDIRRILKPERFSSKVTFHLQYETIWPKTKIPIIHHEAAGR